MICDEAICQLKKRLHSRRLLRRKTPFNHFGAMAPRNDVQAKEVAYHPSVGESASCGLRNVQKVILALIIFLLQSTDPYRMTKEGTTGSNQVENWKRLPNAQ
jgi:hypothetical protein